MKHFAACSSWNKFYHRGKIGHGGRIRAAAGIAALGVQPIPGLNLKNYTDFIRKEVGVWGKVMKEHGIKRQ